MTKDEFAAIFADPTSGTLQADFPLSTRLVSAWRAFRYPHALRNALHFTQEARTVLEEIQREPVGGIVVTTPKQLVEIAEGAVEECAKAEGMIKFISNYEDDD